MREAATQQQTHPYITRQSSVCGGRSIIEGTRIPVWSLVKWYKLGFSVEDIMRDFPGVTPAQVHDAFSYYYDNVAEIEQDIADNEDESGLRNMIT
jgi:type III restriction enzyme